MRDGRSWIKHIFQTRIRYLDKNDTKIRHTNNKHTVVTYCGSLTVRWMHVNTTISWCFNSTKERERGRHRGGGWRGSVNDGLGLDPLYNIFVVHCTTEMAQCTQRIHWKSWALHWPPPSLHTHTHTHLRENTSNTRCNVGGSTGPKAREYDEDECGGRNCMTSLPLHCTSSRHEYSSNVHRSEKEKDQ